MSIFPPTAKAGSLLRPAVSVSPPTSPSPSWTTVLTVPAKATTFSELIQYQAAGLYQPKITALAGVKVVMTGTMSARRDMVETFISQHGGTVGKAIARSDSSDGLLVVANHEMDAWKAGQGGSSKLRDAKNWGVTMWSESEVVAILQQGEFVHTAVPDAPKIIAPPPDHYGDF